MRKSTLVFYIFLITVFSANAQYLQDEQEEQRINYNNSLGSFSAQDSAYLIGLRPLPIPEIYKGANAPLLPDIVDNSTNTCFRPAFQQGGLCCGQAALVGYNYTYEVNRVRGLDGSLPDNQYATHFTWNFWNPSNSGGGVSYFTTMEILKSVGNPNVVDYGGMDYGGNKRWINGYDNYYNAMSNRISTGYSLKVNTPEGIENLKHYLNDHLEGSDIGGLASFYANQPTLNTLYGGTPEAGKTVVVSWGYSNHAMTIVGYNDSIRWDYNGDGQFTNNIDINNDGLVNVKDWEIGGLKFVNSYGGIPNWGDDGFCYMMYKSVADEYGQGGIWNNTVNTLKVKEDCSPLLTMKIKLKHDRRMTVKVSVGFSTDTTALVPDHVFDFPILNYQGADSYMQGGTSEEDKTIEFGLDLSHILSYLNPGDYTKFFLIVDEDDPQDWGKGDYISMSLMDYTSGLIEIPCGENNIPIPDNGTVTVGVIHNVDFNKVDISTVSLPPAPIGEPYNVQLLASGGVDPYFWSINNDYEETTSISNFPGVDGTQLFPSNNNNGTVVQEIDFPFSFYGEEFNSITVHADGFLKFDDDLYQWPYLLSDELVFKKTALIAPYMTDLQIFPSEGDGIWYEGDENGATFYWKTSLNGQPDQSVLEFAVKLFPSGDIRFYYGEMQTSGDVMWFGGTSKGNALDFQFSELSGNDYIPENLNIDFTTTFYPVEMIISEDGFFSGTPLLEYNAVDIKFKVTDNNGIFSNKTLQFSSNGVIIHPSIVSGNDNLIEYAENSVLSLNIINISGVNLEEISLKIAINDINFTLNDSVEYVGSLANGESVELNDAFNFDVSPNVPNYHELDIAVEILAADTSISTNLFFRVFSPSILYDDVLVDDGENNILYPGETTDIIVDIENSGGALAEDINVILSSGNEHISINVQESSIVSLPVDSIVPVRFNITLDENADIGSVIDFDLDISTNNGYANSDDFSLLVGLVMEEFETGDFSLFAWGFEDDEDWEITNNNVYSGVNAVRSGNISHNQESSLIIDFEVQNESEISFYRKVSCEDDTINNNYDYLAFLIDDVEMGRWDGQLDWSLEAFMVSSGIHRFQWKYHKDHSQNSFQDCAFIDNIRFPSGIGINHNLEFHTDMINKSMKPDLTDVDSLVLYNSSVFGDINFRIIIDNTPQQRERKLDRSIIGSTIDCEEKYINTEQNFSWNFTVRNASTDNEWIKDIILIFPDGVSVDSVTNFVGGSGGELEDDGITGNGVTIVWHGETGDGWGLIHGNEQAYATVYGRVDAALESDFSVAAELYGDIYGAEPHILYQDIDFINLGEIASWLTLDTLAGNVEAGGSYDLQLNFNSIDLPVASYSCNLLFFDNFMNETIIPVKLVVEHFVGQDEIVKMENSTTKIFPNPFRDNFSVEYYSEEGITAYADLYNLNGVKIKNWEISSQVTGKQTFVINSNIPLGIYYFTVRVGEKSFVRKLVKM